MATAGLTGKQIQKIYAMARVNGLDGDALAGIQRDVPNRATEAQQLYILRLAKEMGWAGEPARLRGFLEAKAGVSDVKFLDIDGARRMIEALKAIQKGGRAERRRGNERLEE